MFSWNICLIFIIWKNLKKYIAQHTKQVEFHGVFCFSLKVKSFQRTKITVLFKLHVLCLPVKQCMQNKGLKKKNLCLSQGLMADD